VSKFSHRATPFIIRADAKIDGLRAVFDIEADGLLDTATRLHCIVIADLDSDRTDEYGPEQIEAALAHLKRVDYLVGHNLAGYDLPLLHKLHHWTPKTGCTIVDTLIASRLILPNLDDLDDQAAAMGDPALGKLRGRYSLEAWGTRLRIPKAGTDIIDWSKWTPAMQQRCAADVAICKALWQFLQPDGYPAEALALEDRVARICERITADGVPFDVNAAEQLRRQWMTRRSELGAQLTKEFPETNLNSRAQIGALLEARGWIPEARTEKTRQPKITDEILETIPATFPEFTGLSEYMILSRRIAQLSGGKQSWRSHVAADGRIHAGLIHIGTPHSRAKHLTPNIAQVPNPKRGKPLATECRSLFRTNNDWMFVCCDQSGLQDRGYAHYLHEFDDGAYAKSFLNGFDTHWQSAANLGLIAPGTELDKKNKVHVAIREGAKTFRYAFLYGCGQAQAGRIVGNIARTVHHIDAGNSLQKQLFGEAARPNEAMLKRIGKDARNKFIRGTPGLARLRTKLEAHARRYGWLPGLDGRRVPVRALYSALNFIVTSSEAIITKRWLVRVFDELNQKFRYGWDGDCVLTLWIHDELVACCRPEIADQVGKIMVRHAKEAGEFFSLKVPLDAEFKIGCSWAGEEPDDDTKDLDNKRRSSIDNRGDDDGPSSQLHRVDMSPLPVAGAISKHVGAAADQSIARNKICCPFHHDSNPSLQLYPDGHYHCYGCGAHGDIEELPKASPAPASQHNTDTLKRSVELWQATISIHGTLAERYLAETRKLDLATLSDIDAVLRFHPRCPFDGNNHPCVIALFRDVETDEIAGIHRVALTTDAEKIGRMMLGSWPRPRAVKLRAGNNQLITGEGIETVIAGVMRRADKSSTLWAMGSAGAIGKLPLVSGFAGLTVLVDREASNTGLDNARACTEQWRRAGRKTSLAIPHQAKADFNDLIKGKMP
jgi:DNA polymerase I-like protein with 3'-5' exonuclease and polymerase domains